jgi:S1-C subfamily serine protease
MGLQGVLVLDVPPGTPAAKSGLQGITRDAYGRMAIGDVIVGMNGKAVKSEGDLFGGCLGVQLECLNGLLRT